MTEHNHIPQSVFDSALQQATLLASKVVISPTARDQVLQRALEAILAAWSRADRFHRAACWESRRPIDGAFSGEETADHIQEFDPDIFPIPADLFQHGSPQSCADPESDDNDRIEEPAADDPHPTNNLPPFRIERKGEYLTRGGDLAIITGLGVHLCSGHFKGIKKTPAEVWQYDGRYEKSGESINDLVEFIG